MKFIILILASSILVSCRPASTAIGSKGEFPPLAQPVLYARFENLPPLYREKPGACSEAKGYKGPERLALNSTVDLCGPNLSQKKRLTQTPWILPSGVKSFLWEQNYAPGLTIQLELIGPQGLPLPSTSQTSVSGSRAMVELKPGVLPKGALYTLAASEVSATGVRTETYRIPFRIKDG